MDLIEDIGPILGIVAFLGFAILALLIVLQAREVRRLREWAGRAPERALDADEALQAVAEERGEIEPEPGRLRRLRDRVAGAVGPRWTELDRRSPVDPRWLVAGLVAGVIAAGVVTSGFGLVGEGDERAPQGDGAARERPPRVAVLNATQVDDVVPPVPAVSGLADAVAQQVVEPAGFRVTVTGDAAAGAEETVVMYEPEAAEPAERLARRVSKELGETGTEPMTPDVRRRAEGAELAVLVGQDDADFAALGDPAAP